MTTQNPFPLKEFVLSIILIVILILLNCVDSKAQTFNYRDTQKGDFRITQTKDSLHVFESFVYVEDGYKKRETAQWSEKIVKYYQGQQYTTVETATALWLFYYCENDDTCWQICEVVYKPQIGDNLVYKRLLK